MWTHLGVAVFQKRPGTEVDYFSKPTTKTKSIGKKKRNFGTKYSSKANESSETTHIIFERKISLRTHRRSNMDLLPDPPPETVPEELLYWYEQISKLHKPKIDPVHQERYFIYDAYRDTATVPHFFCQE